MKNNKTPKVTLVGAGPGDVDLITVKGLKALRTADVILYDALVNEKLLSEATTKRKIFVGKRMGKKEFTQNEINRLIVEKALNYGHVVRLKGGDPFVFGRGFEEVLYIQKFQIPTAVIPGITSAVSVPSSAGIPVTHRDVSSSFHVLTGTLSNGQLNPDIEVLMHCKGTLVLLMTKSRLRDVVHLYSQANLEETPISLIVNGTLENEIVIKGRMNDIEEEVRKVKIEGPSILVIGNVVELENTKRPCLYDVISPEIKAYASVG